MICPKCGHIFKGTRKAKIFHGEERVIKIRNDVKKHCKYKKLDCDKKCIIWDTDFNGYVFCKDIQ